MIRIYIKDFSIKKQAYKIAVLHHSGMVVDFDVSMAAPMNEVVEKFNQAIAFSEVNMAAAFYSGDEVKNGQKLVTEGNTAQGSPENPTVHQGDQEVPKVEAGDSSIQPVDGTGNNA